MIGLDSFGMAQHMSPLLSSANTIQLFSGPSTHPVQLSGRNVATATVAERC
jgi:hypothetical protein